MKKKFILLLCVLLILITNACYCMREVDIDMFFSIKLGEDVTLNGYSEIDHLTMHENLKYINIRNLYNLLVYNIYQNCGFFGLYIALILITSISTLLIFALMYKYSNKNIKLSLIGTMLSLFLIKDYLYMRTIHISLIIFLIEFYSIKELLYTNKKRYYIYLLILPILLVNIHGSLFGVYFVIYFPFVLEYILSKTKIKEKIQLLNVYEAPQYKNLMIMMIINLFEGLLSPFGFAPYYLTFIVLQGQSIRAIAELLPATWYNMALYLFYFALVIIISDEKTKLHDWLNIFTLIVMSLIFTRAELYLDTIGVILFIGLVAQYSERKEFKYNKKINIAYSAVLAFFIVSSAFYGYKNANAKYIDDTFFPVGATDYIIENLDKDNIRLFNDFNAGSYLEFNGIKPFVDGRSEMFESKYNDTTILADVVNSVYDKKKGYKEYLEKYNFDYYLVNKDSLLYEKMMKDEEFNLKTIYEDSYFVLYK